MSKVDVKEIKCCMKQIIRMAKSDNYHKGNPECQIESLSRIVGDLLAANKNGENDKLIAFFYHVGKSLKELIEYRILNKQNNGES